MFKSTIVVTKYCGTVLAGVLIFSYDIFFVFQEASLYCQISLKSLSV